MAPYTSPFAFSVGVRSSVAAISLRLLVGNAQSHIVITRLRSTPAGRGGASLGSPAGAPRSTHLTIVSISMGVRVPWFPAAGTYGRSVNQGGICLEITTSFIASAHGRVSL